MKSGPILVGFGMLFATAAPALANADHMISACRSYASKHLRVDAGIINVKYEGQRTDGTYAVNGDAETSPAISFQCSFARDGRRIVRWWHDTPRGCPSDVSEANRYMYPDC